VRRLEPLLPEKRLELYAQETGIDLRNLSRALIAGFDLGTLYLAETEADLTPATQAFAERLVSGVDFKELHPRLKRISGVVGRTPQSLLRFDGKLIAVAVGDPTTVRIVEAFARGKLQRTKSVFEGAALESFREFSTRAPLTFLAPGPFEGKWMYGAAGLMAAAQGIGISAAPTDRGSVSVTAAIDGPWEDEHTHAIARMREAWDGLAQSSTGRLFGLHEPVSPPRVAGDLQRLTLTVELELSPIINGLHAAVSADVWEMLDLAPTSTQREGTKTEVAD
jgi:hypothetical protein